MKWGDIKDRIQSIIKDEVPDGSGRKHRYSGDDLIHWWNNAQARLSTMLPRERHWVYGNPDGLDVPLPLPDDILKIVAVYIEREYSLPETTATDTILRNSVGYYVYEGKLYISYEYPITDVFIQYLAYYPDVKDDGSEIILPRWAIEACSLYVAMQAATKEAIADARYRKLGSKYEIPGNPTHNPFLKVAEWLEKRFYDIVRANVDNYSVREMYERPGL